MVHELKILPNYFYDVVSGIKTFEVRFNDRDFQLGDQLLLKEYFKDTDTYGMQCLFNIKFVITKF